MPNRLCHFEISTRDMEKSKKFYTSVFDWKIEPDPNTNYTNIETGQEPTGGLFLAPPEMPLGITTYVLVDSIEETLDKVNNFGGRIIRPKQEIPNIGWFALFMDPEENVLGIFEALKK